LDFITSIRQRHILISRAHIIKKITIKYIELKEEKCNYKLVEKKEQINNINILTNFLSVMLMEWAREKMNFLFDCEIFTVL